MDKKLLGKICDTAFYLTKTKSIGHENFIESFKQNQIKCKLWLVDEIANTNTKFDKILVIGSWNGVLLYELMKESCDIGWFDFLDIDEQTHFHRNTYFEMHQMEKNYNSIKCNAEDFSDFDSYDLIINTSCEHMNIIPVVNGPLYALQSNNYKSVKEHINCVNSSMQLKEQYNITQTVFKGDLDMGHYKRFMVIGSYW